MKQCSGSATMSLEKGLLLLEKIAQEGEATPLARIAEGAGIAPSTAYRIAASLSRNGYIVRTRRGRYDVGPAILRLAGPQPLRVALAACARPVLRALAQATRCTAHLGIFEGEMVTYLVKEAPGGQALFTREGLQHEAYCSALGKILLAHLAPGELEEYLAGGPFIPLTDRTIVDPGQLRAEIESVRRVGYSLDRAEVDRDLSCIAVAVRDARGNAVAALSIATRRSRDLRTPEPFIEQLRVAAAEIEKRVFGPLQE